MNTRLVCVFLVLGATLVALVNAGVSTSPG
jgi:hypothetical protein